MTSFIRVQALGNSTEPQFKYTASGLGQLTFSIAVNRNRKDKDTGEWKEEPPEWLSCVVWGDQAERLANQVHKGQPVYIEGRQQSRSWTNDDGQKHTRTEIHCNFVYPHARPPKGQDSTANVDDGFLD